MHFFPMAMYTHTLVPPPKEVSTELGETRSAKRGAVSVCVYMAIGKKCIGCNMINVILL